MQISFSESVSAAQLRQPLGGGGAENNNKKDKNSECPVLYSRNKELFQLQPESGISEHDNLSLNAGSNKIFFPIK